MPQLPQAISDLLTKTATDIDAANTAALAKSAADTAAADAASAAAGAGDAATSTVAQAHQDAQQLVQALNDWVTSSLPTGGPAGSDTATIAASN